MSKQLSKNLKTCTTNSWAKGKLINCYMPKLFFEGGDVQNSWELPAHGVTRLKTVREKD